MVKSTYIKCNFFSFNAEQTALYIDNVNKNWKLGAGSCLARSLFYSRLSG